MKFHNKINHLLLNNTMVEKMIKRLQILENSLLNSEYLHNLIVFV